MKTVKHDNFAAIYNTAKFTSDTALTRLTVTATGKSRRAVYSPVPFELYMNDSNEFCICYPFKLQVDLIFNLFTGEVYPIDDVVLYRAIVTGKMSRKRLTKLLMGHGFSRNLAQKVVTLSSDNLTHAMLWVSLSLEEFSDYLPVRVLASEHGVIADGGSAAWKKYLEGNAF